MPVRFWLKAPIMHLGRLEVCVAQRKSHETALKKLLDYEFWRVSDIEFAQYIQARMAYELLDALLCFITSEDAMIPAVDVWYMTAKHFGVKF